MGDMWFRAVPVVAAGRFARKGDEVTGTLKVPQPARRRRGVTLIEAVLYIAIALALIVGGLVFYQQASTAARMNSLVTMLSSVMAEARAAQSESSATILFQNNPVNFTSYLVTRGSVPQAWLDKSKPANEQIRHPWGGFVQFESGIVTGVNPYHLVTVRMSDVPMQLCVRLGATFGNGATVYSGGYLGGLAYDVFSPPFPGRGIAFETVRPCS